MNAKTLLTEGFFLLGSQILSIGISLGIKIQASVGHPTENRQLLAVISGSAI